jgi:hypothetical protein
MLITHRVEALFKGATFDGCEKLGKFVAARQFRYSTKASGIEF